MTREAYKKHKNVMEWFYIQPEQTTYILVRDKENDSWYSINNPSFAEKDDYLINDAYVELRKAIYEGKSIEFLDMHTNKWSESITQNPNCIFVHEVKRYRVKKEIKYPVYKKNQDVIAKFINEERMKPVFLINLDTKMFRHLDVRSEVIGCTFYHDINHKEWEDVVYDEETGLWDGQPVWCWDDGTETLRVLKFYDAKNKVCFNSEGGRSGYFCDNYIPYPHVMDEWIIESYKKLKF